MSKIEIPEPLLSLDIAIGDVGLTVEWTATVYVGETPLWQRAYSNDLNLDEDSPFDYAEDDEDVEQAARSAFGAWFAEKFGTHLLVSASSDTQES